MRRSLLVGLVLLLPLALAGCGGDDDGELTVALSGKYPPFNFHSNVSGDLVGFDVDVANEIGKRLDRPVRFDLAEILH